MWARLQAACRNAGFSVMAANLYAGGVISVGTLLAVFLATSDEAVLILLGNPQYAPEVGRLLAVKVVIAIAGGYVADLCLKDRLSEKRKRSPVRKLRLPCRSRGDPDAGLETYLSIVFSIFFFLPGSWICAWRSLAYRGFPNFCWEIRYSSQ